MKNCSKLAVLGSFSIWNARYSSDWNGGAVLKPWRANTHSDSPSNPLSMYFSCIVMTYSSWCSATELGDPPRARCDLWCFPWIQLLHDAVYWKLTLFNKLVRSLVSIFGWNIIFIHSDQYDYSTLNSIIILHNIICIIIPIQYLEKIKSDTVTDT